MQETGTNARAYSFYIAANNDGGGGRCPTRHVGCRSQSATPCLKHRRRFIVSTVVRSLTPGIWPMTFDELLLIPATGFAFETPVPLPLLGHKIAYPMRFGSIEAIIYIELRTVDTQRVGSTKISSSGSIMYHDRDRF